MNGNNRATDHSVPQAKSTHYDSMGGSTMKYLMATLVVVATLVIAPSAFAAPSSASNMKSTPLGYCGPPVGSKSQMIGYYMMNPTARMHAEHYVRAHAAYYHIQADQSFFAWLQMPNIKFFLAPSGYTLTAGGGVPANTYCHADGTVLPYYGHYSVGGLGMLWWCTNPAGNGSGCTPITKGYCRNFVHGHMIRPIHKPTPKPHKPKKPKTPPIKCAAGFKLIKGQCVQQVPTTPAAPGSCNVTITNSTVTGDINNCSTVTITVICGTLSQTFTGSKDTAQQQANTWQQANCTSSSPPPPSGCTSNCGPPPPAPSPPSCNNVTTPENGSNGIFANGESYPGTVQVFAKNGDSLTVSFGVNLGSGSITSSSTFTSNGTDNPTWVYNAPNDSSAAGKYGKITITVHDNTTGLTGSCSSGSFLISAPPAPRP
jgi:hypothetical protein